MTGGRRGLDWREEGPLTGGRRGLDWREEGALTGGGRGLDWREEAEEVGHCMLPYIRDQILELAKESLLVVL